MDNLKKAIQELSNAYVNENMMQENKPLPDAVAKSLITLLNETSGGGGKPFF